jgi:hypothetical protein
MFLQSFPSASFSQTFRDEIPVFTSDEATKACESLWGTKKFVHYAWLRNFWENTRASRELSELSPQAMDANWSMQRHFGQIKMISSNPESARSKRSQQELASTGLTCKDYEIVPSVDGSKLDKALWSRMAKWGTEKLSPEDSDKRLWAQTGCYMAHYNAISTTILRYKEAIERLKTLRASDDPSSEELLGAINQAHNTRSVFIFEDNVGIGKVTGQVSDEKTGFGRIFRQVMSELNADWDMLYFMSMYGADKASEHLALLHYGLVRKAYAISAKMYDKALSALEVVNKPDQELKPVDHVLASLHKTSRAYVTLPPLVYRATSESEVFADIGKEKKSQPSHLQNFVSVKRSKEEIQVLKKTIEAHCEAADKWCALSKMTEKAIELRANNFEKAKEQLFPVNDFTNKNQELKDIGKKAKSSRHLPGVDFSGTDIVGRQSFMFCAVPYTYTEAGSLMSVLLHRKGTVMVSTLESFEAKHKGNNFWKKENISKLVMQDGWKVEHASEKETHRGAERSKILETTLNVSNGIAVLTMTHLHLDGWVDRCACPDDQLLFELIMRMRQLNPDPTIPFSINCHGGIGRTGTTGMCLELFNEIDAQRKEGKALDEIQLTVLGRLYNFRMQGRDIIHQETAFAQIFAVVGIYYSYLKAQEALGQREEVKA